MTTYPSIAGTPLGRLLGVLYESLPARVGGIKLSHLLFPLPTAPLALAEFFRLKVMGDVYVITNQSVQKRTSLGNRLVASVPLANIDQVVVRQEPGQSFYPAADVYLLNKGGEALMELPGVLRADVFRQNILEAARARTQTQASLAVINARHPAGAAS